MTIIEDTRQQAEKHKLKHRYFADNQIKVVRSKLLVGDYANIKNMSVIVDTKKDIQEIIGNVTNGHKRFVSECDLAYENDIKLIKEGVRNVEIRTTSRPRKKYEVPAEPEVAGRSVDGCAQPIEDVPQRAEDYTSPVISNG